MNVSREEIAKRNFESRMTDVVGAAPVDASDGRVANRLRNRAKVIDAFIALIEEGKASTVDEVVARSGVARRSIFRHFTDLPDLMIESLRRVVTDAVPLAVIKDLGVGSLEDRVDAFIDARLRALAHTYPFRSALNSRLAEFEQVQQGLKVANSLTRDQITTQFAEELAGRSEALVEQTVDLVYLVTSFESYDVMVKQIGRPVEVVRAAWTVAVTQLLRPL